MFGNRYQKAERNPNNPFAQQWVADGAFDLSTNRFKAGLTYDTAGNITADTRFRQRQFIYDANNRQRWAALGDGTHPVTAVFDGTGQRVATQSGEGLRIMVYDAFGQLVAEYGASAEQPSGRQYVMTDHQGSTRVVMKGDGTLSRHDYLPFGEELLVAGIGMRTAEQGYGAADGARHGYAGMEDDDATGMPHTLWRKYDDASGRLSERPSVPARCVGKKVNKSMTLHPRSAVRRRTGATKR